MRLGCEGKSRGLKGCGRVPDFLLCASESAEQLWNEVENRLGPAIKAARDGHLHDHDSHVSAIRDGIALHLVRSLRYVEIDHVAVAQTIENVRRTAPVFRRSLLEAEFQRRHGLVPAGPEALVASTGFRWKEPIDMSTTIPVVALRRSRSARDRRLMRVIGSACGRLGRWWPPAGEHFCRPGSGALLQRTCPSKRPARPSVMPAIVPAGASRAHHPAE